MKLTKIKGLRQRIAEASKPEDCSALLLLGTTYSDASAKTKRAWRATANRRQKFLKAEVVK